MNLNDRKPVQLNTNVPHPDLSLVRKYRIEKYEWLLSKAEADDNLGLERKFKKEIEIQKCYLQIGK